jgi:hypothetical protein
MSETQLINSSSLDMINLGQEFIVYINSILTALNINSDSNLADKILHEMRVLDDKAKYKIISDAALKDNVSKLLEADRNLINVFTSSTIQNRIKNKDDVKKEWNTTMGNFAKLQGLIILRKISENDCDGLIKSLLGAFNKKLEAVNQVLASDLTHDQAGGTNNNYLKYLKYKNKYLRLRKNNI